MFLLIAHVQNAIVMEFYQILCVDSDARASFLSECSVMAKERESAARQFIPASEIEDHRPRPGGCQGTALECALEGIHPPAWDLL